MLTEEGTWSVKSKHANVVMTWVDMAGALVAYLYKCKSLSKTGEQLTSIAGVLGFNLVIGSLQETRLDNLGGPLPLPAGTACFILLVTAPPSTCLLFTLTFSAVLSRAAEGCRGQCAAIALCLVHLQGTWQDCWWARI